MNSSDEFISSYPTGKWKLDKTLKPNIIQINVKTSEQVANERNSKINDNKFICENIKVDNNEDFTNYQKKDNKINYIILLFIGIIFLLIILYYLLNKYKIIK